LIDDLVAKVLVEQTGRNPRRIKKIVNSFVIESSLNPTWFDQPLDAPQLVTATILQHLYPGFFDLLVDSPEGSDVIGDFLEYVVATDRAGSPPAPSDAWWSILGRVLRRYHVAVPRRNAGVPLSNEVFALNVAVPPAFPSLAKDLGFIALLREIGDYGTREAFRSQLGRTRAERSSNLSS
jgi:hypothetical protein